MFIKESLVLLAFIAMSTHKTPPQESAFTIKNSNTIVLLMDALVNIPFLPLPWYTFPYLTKTIMLHTQIRDGIKQAMLAKEATRLSVLRGMLTAFTNDLVAKGMKPQDEISDADALAVIKRLAKQRKESIDQYKKGGRPDLAEQEKEELVILETYLPTAMSREEIKKIAETKIAELGIADKSKMGMLMGAIIKEAQGTADGADVKAVVDELLG